MPIAPGSVLAGRYQVERVLGKGAMGVVVAARHVELGELFAVKLLLPQAMAQPQAVDRFVREARAAARLKGEHVVKVTDVGRLEDGSPYMVMEHLTGTDLQQLVRTRGPLPIEEAVTYVLQACDGIAEAHALGIVHRDLKPSNLFLIRRRNGSGCVKVLDFGISKQTTPEAVDLTKTGEIFGTPLYMAPEQMARTKNADARSDVWSMGIVLHELLTGTTPFHATTITEVVARVLQEDAPPPSHLRAGIPPALDAIVATCLQKRPDMRFQSIEDLAAALRGGAVPAVASDPRAPSFPVIQTAPVQAAVPQHSMLAGGTPTVTLPEKSPPTAPLPATPVAPAGMPASTASSWGSTGRMRVPGSGGLVLVLAAGGVLAALLAAGGIWFALRPPSAAGTIEEPAPAETAAAPAEPTASSGNAEPAPPVTPSGLTAGPSPPPSSSTEAVGASPATPATASTAPVGTAAAGALKTTAAVQSPSTIKPKTSAPVAPSPQPTKKKREPFR